MCSFLKPCFRRKARKYIRRSILATTRKTLARRSGSVWGMGVANHGDWHGRYVLLSFLTGVASDLSIGMRHVPFTVVTVHNFQQRHLQLKQTKTAMCTRGNIGRPRVPTTTISSTGQFSSIFHLKATHNSKQFQETRTLEKTRILQNKAQKIAGFMYSIQNNTTLSWWPL